MLSGLIIASLQFVLDKQIRANFTEGTLPVRSFPCPCHLIFFPIIFFGVSLLVLFWEPILAQRPIRSLKSFYKNVKPMGLVEVRIIRIKRRKIHLKQTMILVVR